MASCLRDRSQNFAIRYFRSANSLSEAAPRGLRPAGYLKGKEVFPMRYTEPSILWIAKATSQIQGGKHSVNTEAPETPSIAPAYEADE